MPDPDAATPSPSLAQGHPIFLMKADPPPCERPTRCRHYDECADRELACTAFVRWINQTDGYRRTKHRRGNPTRADYREVFPLDEPEPFDLAGVFPASRRQGID